MPVDMCQVSSRVTAACLISHTHHLYDFACYPLEHSPASSFQGAKIVKASHFELEYMLGRKITFFCMAQGYPRPEITWFKDGIELYAHKFFQVHEWPLGNDTVKSKMEIDPTTQKDAGYYECQANNKYAIDTRGFRTDYVMIAY
ncbi:immunoglobulin domain-containing protein oig-4-like isoform X2 [Zophobas morio]|uniref:immunoglobulin domain-containing protein oig-4-like isoform X2 n=1 Tax=Zophobas morio TaxID=2755281 RepID=UPI003083B908